MSDLDMFLLGLIVKWTILLSIFWIAYWSIPRTSLKPRVWLWRVALLASIGVAIVSLLQPLARWPLLATIETPAVIVASPRGTTMAATSPTASNTTAPSVDMADESARFADMPLDITPVDVDALAANRPARSWSSVLIAGWMVVSGLILARLILIMLRDQRLLKVRQPVDGAAREQFDRLLEEIGKSRRVVIELAWSRVIDSPLATGIWRPRILLPETLRGSDEATLRSALAHELAHIVSRDIGWSLALRLWQSMAWVCPLVWLIPRQHQEACELLADHQASHSLANRADYRQILATLALNLLAPSARRVPRGAAISMLRTPMILYRLRMLETGGAHARVTLLTRCAFSMICMCGLLLGGIGIARTRAQEALANSPLIETRPVILGDDANEKTAGDSIRVLAPDGSPAKEVRMVIAANRYAGNVLLSEDSKIFPLISGITFSYPGLSTFRSVLKPTELAGEGGIKRSSLGNAEFLVVWNEQGFHQLVMAQLTGLKEVKLQPWSGLDVQVRHGDQLLANCEIEVSCGSTGDGVHQGVTVIVVGSTDDKGRLVLQRVPPGALRIGRKTVEKVFGNSTTFVSPRTTTVLAHPGEVLEVTQGGGGQTVEGKLQLAGFLPEAFQAELTTDDRHEVFDFDVGADGNFAIEDVRAGRYVLRFRNVKTFNIFATHEFECPGNRNEPPFSVGTIKANQGRIENVAEQPAREGIVRNWMPTKIAMAGTTEPVRKIDYDGHYVLRGAEGQVLLDLTDVNMPGGWSSASAHFDLDARNQRLALLVREADGKQYLSVISDRGEPLWTRHLKSLESHRIAIDTKTGNLWLLVKNTLSDGTVKVFSPDGAPLQSYEMNAFTLAYCESDNTFWLGGQNDVKKVNAKDGSMLATYTLPKGIFSINQLLCRSDGSVLAGEGAHPDMPGSANRLWHIDAQGKLISAVDLGNLYIQTHPPQPFGDDYIAPASRRFGWIGAGEHEDLLIRISDDLKSVRKITQLEEEVVQTDTPGQVWLASDNKRWHVTWDKNGKVLAREVAK